MLLTDGLARELVDLNPARVRCCDLDTAARRAKAVGESDRRLARSLLERRRDDDATDGTFPLVLMCGAEQGRVDDIETSPRGGVVALRASVRAADGSERLSLCLRRDGHVRLGGFADELVAFGLPSDCRHRDGAAHDRDARH